MAARYGRFAASCDACYGVLRVITTYLLPFVENIAEITRFMASVRERAVTKLTVDLRTPLSTSALARTPDALFIPSSCWLDPSSTSCAFCESDNAPNVAEFMNFVGKGRGRKQPLRNDSRARLMRRGRNVDILVA